MSNHLASDVRSKNGYDCWIYSDGYDSYYGTQIKNGWTTNAPQCQDLSYLNFYIPEGSTDESEYAASFKWTVADNSIAKIVDGKIVPLKAGSTTISTFYKGVEYQINLEIPEDIAPVTDNPNTSDSIIKLLTIGLISISLIGFGSLFVKKRR